MTVSWELVSDLLCFCCDCCDCDCCVGGGGGFGGLSISSCLNGWAYFVLDWLGITSFVRGDGTTNFWGNGDDRLPIGVGVSVCDVLTNALGGCEVIGVGVGGKIGFDGTVLFFGDTGLEVWGMGTCASGVLGLGVVGGVFGVFSWFCGSMSIRSEFWILYNLAAFSDWFAPIRATYWPPQETEKSFALEVRGILSMH